MPDARPTLDITAPPPAPVETISELVERWRISKERGAGFSWLRCRFPPKVPSATALRLTLHHPSTKVCWSPDGTLIAALAVDGRSTIWNSTSGRQRGVLPQSAGPIAQAMFLPDNRLLSAAQNAIVLWDVPAGRELNRFERTGDILALSRDGDLFAVAGNRSIEVRETSSGRLVRSLGVDADIAYIGFVGSETKVLIGGSPGTIQVWDFALDESANIEVGQIEPECHQFVFAVSPDGARAAMGWSSWSTLSNSRGGGMVVSDLAEGKVVAPAKKLLDPVTCLAFSPDGRLASGSGEGETWSDPIPPPYGMGIAVTYSGYAHTIGVDAYEKEPKPFVLRGHTDEVLDVAFAHDGRLASCARDGTIRIWTSLDAAEAIDLFPSDAAKGTIEAVAIAADGTWACTRELASIYFQKLDRYWDTASGANLGWGDPSDGRLHLQRAMNLHAASPADQRQFAAEVRDGETTVVDVARQQPVGYFPAPLEHLCSATTRPVFAGVFAGELQILTLELPE